MAEERKDNAMPNSNAVWLTGRQWLIVAVLLVALFVSAPMLWTRVETFEPGPDYRIPYALSSDYCSMPATAAWRLVMGRSP